ncbi:hypothetical protein DY000_02039747 [Brassica cretica]|uniref:Uncharacterized protein n=1 Tax=Brassica cretica TaxID=69181 RepID=A0ABQ7B8W4_BRACR|nr:hypothetical protein DY000_02039747 [Brassica cretica]
MEIDRVPMGRTLRKRKEKVAKHLKRGANEKERESFQKRVFRIPVEKPFEEAYFTNRLWMFFRETRETEVDIRRMFVEAREKMKKRITLKKKNDPGVMTDYLGLQVEPSKELFTFVDCSQRSSGRIVRGPEVQIVGAVCNLQTNQLCLTLIDPHVHYNPIPVKKPQTSSRRINDPGLIAACHCGAEYETEYSASIETHTATSIDSAHQKSIDSSPKYWENDYYNPTMAAHTRHTMHMEEYDEDYEEERTIEYRAILDEEDRLLHHSSWKTNAPSIDRTISTSIDTHPHQTSQKRALTDIAYFPSIDTGVDRVREGDYSIGSWADDHHHESYAVETEIHEPGVDEPHEGFTYEELLNMQRRDEVDQQRAEATGERTRFRHSIDRANRLSIDEKPPSSIYICPKPSSTVSKTPNYDNQYLTQNEFGIFRDPDGYARAIDGHALQVYREEIADILQMANGADNLFMQQRTVPTHQQRVTKKFYDELGCARDVDGHIINVSKDDIRKLMERASRDEHSCICLPEHASSFTQTKLMKLDGVYYPLNDSISWLTTCMEEMRQDIAKIQHAADKHRPASIDRHYSTSIDENLPHSHPMKSQPDFHTRPEIDQLVEEIYRTLETTKERLDRRCDDIYFPMDLTMSDFTSQIQAIHRELVEIQSYIARRPEASASIDRYNNKSTDIHRQISVDDATNRGRLLPKVTSDMSDTHNHGEEISADTYATLMRHQFNLERLGDRLQKMENTTATIKERWRGGDEAIRDFTDSTKDNKVDQPINYSHLLGLFEGTKANLQH